MTNKLTFPLLLEECKKYYKTLSDGNNGNFYIVLANGNIEDRHINVCIKNAKEKGDIDGENLGLLLLSASKTQRKKLINNNDFCYPFLNKLND